MSYNQKEEIYVWLVCECISENVMWSFLLKVNEKAYYFNSVSAAAVLGSENVD